MDNRINRRHRQKRLTEAQNRGRRAGINARNQARNIAARVALAEERRENEPYMIERRALLNILTNWQRNQANRVCEGMWDRLTNEKLVKFSQMRKPA